MIDSSFLSSLRKIDLIINKRVTSGYRGERKSISIGGGTIFKDHRIYSMGDNYKAVDWKVYARTGDMFIKLFEEERNLDVHILIDTSASMHYKNKFDYAGQIALGMAYLAMKNNERIHFATFSDKLEVFPAAKGKSQISFMLDRLNDIRPHGETKMIDSLYQYKKYVRSKSFIVIISDFMVDSKKVIEAISVFGKDQIVKLVQVLDDDEMNMNMQGDYKFTDSESGLVLRTYISNKLREEYLEKLKEHVDEIRALAAKYQFSFNQFTTNQPIFDVFFEVLMEKT